ncbi:MAG TPA: hypothetical protein GX505_04275 [Clostridiales bacterium]|nr:hypothetical protein [Clostridiales bacterium]
MRTIAEPYFAKKSINNQKNSLISPISVMLALAMTANGANGETLSQMEQVIGRDIHIDELNQHLKYFSKNLPNEEKAKLKIANSIWFRNDELLTVEKDFLQKNADYYNAEIYKIPFTELSLLSTVNDAESTIVNAVMPKFSYKYDVVLDDVLKDLGMPDAFDEDKADFSKMGKYMRPITIDRVIHKTFISLDEMGTKAGGQLRLLLRTVLLSNL